MPIAEHEAVAWVRPLTADQLVPLPTERLTWSTARFMIEFRTGVIHCLVPSGPSPPLSFRRISASPHLQDLCQKVSERDAVKREECDEAPQQHGVMGSRMSEEVFLRTFGHRSLLDVQFARQNYPFVQVCCQEVDNKLALTQASCSSCSTRS